MGNREPIHLRTIGVREETHTKLAKLRKTAWGEVTMDLVISVLLKNFGDKTIDPRGIAKFAD